MENEHTEQCHKERVNALCRVCGKRSLKRHSKVPVKQCKHVQTELKRVHNIDIVNDNCDTHSGTLCNLCYGRLKLIKCCGEKPPETTLKNAISESDSTADLWTSFNSSLALAECKTCMHFSLLSRAGRPIRKKRGRPKQVDNADIAADVSCADGDTSDHMPLDTSTPVKVPRMVDMQTSPIHKIHTPPKATTDTSTEPSTSKQFTDTATSPILSKKTLRKIDDLSFPLSKAEIAYHTKLTKMLMNNSRDKSTVSCKTKGQPLVLKKIIMPRKPSQLASSPLKKKRARVVQAYRRDIAGSTVQDAIKQHSSELKKSSKKVRKELFQQAGINTPAISPKEGSFFRTDLGLSWNKSRKYRKFLNKIGVDMASEKEERQFQREIACGEIKIERIELDDSNTNQKTEMPVGYVGHENLPQFVDSLLNQYEEEGLLTWHNETIPENEVWVKIGGDYGGDSFKLMLQIANLRNTNSKRNTSLITLAHCKDTHANLKKILKPYKQQINNLTNMTWKDKQIRVFLFGDYDFLSKIYGLSGAQSVHPCLWCRTSKNQMQKSRTQQPDIQERTLHNMKQDYRRFCRSGQNKKHAKAYNNVIHFPLFQVQLSHITPPYLHILLGIVKRHHDLLEQHCHTLDKQIALALAQENTEHEHDTPFGQYINSLHSIEKDEKEKQRYETRLTEILEIERETNNQETLKEEKSTVQDRIDTLYDSIESKRNDLTELPFLSGPVTSNLDTVLKANKITVQAYHGRSFVGNHCHKYLQADTTTNICQSIVAKTYQLTDNHTLHAEAHDIANKFQTLNSLFSNIHNIISHARPITENALEEADQNISSYMHFFREHFAHTPITPKQHILECHCLHFMQNWRFGLGHLGEQGGEETHAFVNELKARVRGIRDAEQQIRVLMQEQMTIVSPRLQGVLPGQKKKTV